MVIGNNNQESNKATPKFRIDSAEKSAPTPHAFQLPEQSDISRLARWLDRDDLTLHDFGERLSRYPGLSRYIIAVANHSIRRQEGVISEPVHAAAFLGISGLRRVFEPLAG